MLKFLLGETGGMAPLIVLVGGLAFFLLIAIYVLTDGRRSHRRHMESLPLEGD